MKKFLVFHIGRTPCSQKTDWVLHGYHLKEDGQYSVMCRKGSTFIRCKIFQKNSFGEQKGRPCSVDPITKETDEGEIITGEVLDCASNPTIDASFSPKVTQAHAVQNAELIEVVQKKIHVQASKEVQQIALTINLRSLGF